MSKNKLHFQRFEFKYQLPLCLVDGMIPKFLKHMQVDAYARDLPDNAYTVASLYYDSAGYGCYYDKIAGLKTRKKLRIRYYPDAVTLDANAPVFLEIKRKYNNVVVKDRLALKYEDCYNLLERNKYSGLPLSEREKQTLDEFLWLKLSNGMLPQNMVVYKRRPFVSKFDSDFRVTIDFDLKTYVADTLKISPQSIAVNPDNAVLEVKFNNVLPFWFHRIIQQYNLDQRPFSKYCTCLEACKKV